jgi:hypothetical protein
MPTIYVFAVIIVSILAVAPLLYVLRKEKQRRAFFDKNGGEILESMNIKTFTEAELEKITNHYRERPLWQGFQWNNHRRQSQSGGG